MQHSKNNNIENSQEYCELVTSYGKWHYNSSISREVLEKDFPGPDTIASSNGGGLDKVFSNSSLSHYILRLSPQEQYNIRHYHTNLINRFKSRGSGQVNSVDWLAIARSNGLPCPELVAWSKLSGGSIIVTRSMGESSCLSDYLFCYPGPAKNSKYCEDIPSELAEVLRATGRLAGTMHRAGLLLADFSASSIAVVPETLDLTLLDLETMQRCITADPQNIFCDILSDNLATLAADIFQSSGHGALEIFIQGYLDTAVASQQQYRSFYNHIHTLARYHQSKKFHAIDKQSLQDNQYFQRLKLADNFQARVYLQSKEPKAFSAISSMSFCTEQWKSILEPLILSKKLFTRKELTLKFPSCDIPVSVEGGPGKEIIAKWQLGHCLISRGIDTPWPLALIMYNKQAVIVTEKKHDNICRNFRNILIVKPSALGDIARAIPVLTALRERYPNSRITWLVRPEFADLVKYHPALDDIILFDKKKFNHLSLATARWIRKYSQALLGCRFDLVLDMQGLLRSGLITAFTKAPNRIGYRRARELAWLFYSKKVNTPEINHSNDDCWRIGLAAGLTPGEPGFGLPVERNSYATAKEILARNTLAENDDYISILPGGTADEKIWSPQNFGNLAKAIYQKYNIRSVIIGAGKREGELAEIISTIAGSQVAINLVGQSSLSEMTAIIGNSLMAIGNDSGPLHIAAAIPRTVIGIYGPTNPKAVGPVNQLHNVIEAGPGIKRHGRYSKDPRHDINNITVQQVLEKFIELLNKPNQTPDG